LTETQIIPKPPQSSDWRETERWMQKIYMILGSYGRTTSYNVPKTISDNKDDSLTLYWMDV
jgi:hypothetical protein